MTENELKEFLEANKADIQAEVRKRMIDGLVTNQRWEITSAMNKAVADFITTEIIPEVRSYLEGEKGAILEACKAAAVEIGNTLAKTMAEKAAKNIDGYKFRDAMSGLFS